MNLPKHAPGAYSLPAYPANPPIERDGLCHVLGQRQVSRHRLPYQINLQPVTDQLAIAGQLDALANTTATQPLLHRTLPTGAVLAGITEATAAGVFDADVIAMTARRFLHAATSPPSPPPVPVPEGAPPAALVHRPAPCLGSYDQLLTGAGA